MRRLLLVLLTVVSASPAAWGQPDSDPSELVQAMQEAVDRLDYETAEARARDALARFAELAPDQLLRVHTTLGLLLHARGDAVEARQQFEAALSLDPGLVLDPVLVSPVTLEFFETIKAERDRAEPAGAVPTVRYVVLEDRRAGAALRSLLAPGWGQFYKGDRTQGWVFASAAGTLLAGTLLTSVARGQARSDYLDAATSAEAADLYATYNGWHRARTAFAVGTALVWVASATEALATGGPRAPAALQVTPAPGGLRLVARF